MRHSRGGRGPGPRQAIGSTQPGRQPICRLSIAIGQGVICVGVGRSPGDGDGYVAFDLMVEKGVNAGNYAHVR